MFRRKPGFFPDENLEVVLGKFVVGIGDKGRNFISNA